MQETATKIVEKTAEIDPTIFIQLIIIAFAIGIIFLLIWGYLKYIKPLFMEYEEIRKTKETEPCIKECVYKNEFKKQTEEMSKINGMICKSVDVFSDVKTKLDSSAIENREAFAQLINKSEKQNEVLSKLSTTMDLQTQLIMSVLNKK